MKNLEVWPGSPYPSGAVWDGNGVNFSIFANNATGVDLCLFDHPEGQSEKHRIRMKERTHQEWHVYVPGLKPGQLYGYRVHGPYEPENGLRFNPNKLLIDPYALAIAGTIKWHDAMFGYEVGRREADLSFDKRDSAPFTPKSVVIDTAYDWEGDKPLRIPYHRTIIYEMHVKGFTYLHPDVPDEIRGSYAAMSHPVVIDYLKSLGITAVELLPIHHFVTDRHLEEKGLTNYWGYNTIGFFAPDVRYSSSGVQGEQVREFKDMVKALHKAGIEVILDVVYNHTAEGNQMGPTISFRGVDNSSYYRLVQDNARYYMDYTGTGNTLNMMHPGTLKLIMDSLRYWISEMHIDGFRFDLASALARELHEVDRLSAFFDIIHQDPLISRAKLIAEPWDVGEGGYQVGKFPGGWAEWNGLYRDCIRDFWRGEDRILGEFASRITGSSDLYMDDWRKPTASVNFITAHDGFTLNDLVSYNDKHNEANGEDNKDGANDNRSWNCGVEGPTDNGEIIELRNRQKRNFLTTMFLSQGVPMLVMGDEMGRTQHGNNNAYCQDSEISWMDWKNTDLNLLEFTRKLIRLQKEHPSFCRRKWFQGQPIKGSGVTDIAWFLPEGVEMEQRHWEETHARSLAMFLYGKGIHSMDNRGKPIEDDTFYVIFNAHYEAVLYTLPEKKWGTDWERILDTNDPETNKGEKEYKAGDKLAVEGRSVIVLCRREDKN